MSTETSALSRELTRMQKEAAALTAALSRLQAVQPELARVAAVHPVSSVYANRYATRIDARLDALECNSLNDGEVARKLTDLVELTGGDPDFVKSSDGPQYRLREFTWYVPLADSDPPVTINYTFPVFVREDGECQIVIDHYEEVTESRWVEEKVSKPVMRIVCPE